MAGLIYLNPTSGVIQESISLLNYSNMKRITIFFIIFLPFLGCQRNDKLRSVEYYNEYGDIDFKIDSSKITIYCGKYFFTELIDKSTHHYKISQEEWNKIQESYMRNKIYKYAHSKNNSLPKKVDFQTQYYVMISDRDTIVIKGNFHNKNIKDSISDEILKFIMDVHTVDNNNTIPCVELN